MLGIDPGLSGCGYGAVRTRNRALTAVACGVLRTDAGAPLPERLATLEAELERFLAEVRPCALAVCHLWRTPLQASVARAVAGNPA